MTAILPPLSAPRAVASIAFSDTSSRTARTFGVDLGLLGLGHDHAAEVERGGRVHHRRGEQVGQRRAEQRVADQRRARDRREPRRHHHEQLRARELVQVGLDHQRRLGLAEEDDRGGVDRLDLGRVHQPRDRAADDLHEPLDHAQVEQQPDERAQEDDHGQHLQREDRRLLVGHQRAEEEVDAGVGVVDQRLDLAGDEVERVLADRPAQHEHRERDLDREPDDHRPPGDLRAVARDRVRDARAGTRDRADPSLPPAYPRARNSRPMTASSRA